MRSFLNQILRLEGHHVRPKVHTCEGVSRKCTPKRVEVSKSSLRVGAKSCWIWGAAEGGLSFAFMLGPLPAKRERKQILVVYLYQSCLSLITISSGRAKSRICTTIRNQSSRVGRCALLWSRIMRREKQISRRLSLTNALRDACANRVWSCCVNRGATGNVTPLFTPVCVNFCANVNCYATLLTGSALCEQGRNGERQTPVHTSVCEFACDKM